MILKRGIFSGEVAAFCNEKPGSDAVVFKEKIHVLWVAIYAQTSISVEVSHDGSYSY